MDKRGWLINHAPWIIVLIITVLFNWNWWIDRVLFPAWQYMGGHSMTEDGQMTDVFKQGEKVCVFAVANNKRLCHKSFERTIIKPNGSKTLYNRTAAAHNTLGIGSVEYCLDSEQWEPGEYRLIVRSINYCNSPWPPQVHRGSDLTFVIE